MTEILNRQTFTTSRLLEFFTERELTTQMGHSQEWWKISLLKELIDNALDATETSGTPEITIQIDSDKFSVEDNGGGIPEKIIKRSMDYSVRVSDKSYYISPTRGQLGNALKCVYAAPYVETGTGIVKIQNGNDEYTIQVLLDRISQKPKVEFQKSKVESNCKKVTVYYADSATLLETPKSTNFYNPYSWTLISAYELVKRYSVFNPHAKFVINGQTYLPTITNWQKWLPNSPTSAHWYTPEQLRELIRAYLANDRDSEKTIREFVSEFRGLSGTAKQKESTQDTGMSGMYLKDLIENDDVLLPPVERILSSMKQHSKEVKAEILGVIGEEHFKTKMVNEYNITPESFRYKRIAKIENSLPHVVEVAFGVYKEENEKDPRTVISGLNWTPSFNPLNEVNEFMRANEIEAHDPVCVFCHIARPRFEFTDKGKENVCL